VCIGYTNAAHDGCYSRTIASAGIVEHDNKHHRFSVILYGIADVEVRGAKVAELGARPREKA
ncbi:MAG: hypothetical protein M3R30_04290, partial [Candidatus Eremiobacteraeota bacterium]|nr:hypothetical protein [Candidatus Eremiobacteraeota bacterium]